METIKLQFQMLGNKFILSYLGAAKRIEHQCISLGFVGIIGFMGYYLVWEFFLPQEYDNVGMRLLGAGLCFVLMFKDYWPLQLRKFFPLYWYLMLIYVLPFFFSFMLFKNHLSHMWLTSSLVCLFLLILLLDWLSLVVVSAVGVGGAFVVFWATGNSIDPPSHDYLEDLILFPFAAYSGVVLRYHTDLETREKLRGVLSAASSMAHELRTPLLGIKTGIAGLKKYVPALFKGYQMAREQGLPVPVIRGAHYHALFPVLERIEEEADYSNVIIDMMLMNAKKHQVDFSSFSHYSIASCVLDALERYPFGSDIERGKVTWDRSSQDFTFWGSNTLLVHVLFNLLKNALYFIAKGEKGNISIWTTCQNEMHCLHFKDTGTGIPPQTLPHIFDRFYSTTNVGTGIGLSFCKMVMESFGGRITCNSVYGEYTEFVLRFPIGVNHES